MKNIYLVLLSIMLIGGCIDMLNKEKKVTAEERMHHYLGIELNGQTWRMLAKEKLSDEDKARMINYAKGSLYHWELSPMFKSVNRQRGEWLISHVYTIIGLEKQALEHAQLCMKLTKELELKDFDLAYAYEGLARAYALNKDSTNKRKYFDLAKITSEKIKNPEDRKLFISDLEASPWFEEEK